MQNASSGEKRSQSEDGEDYQGREICEGILRILRIFRVIDPLSGGIVSIIGQQAEVKQACADAGFSPTQWMSLYDLVFMCNRKDQLYVDLCRTVVLFLQELSLAYNFCTPANSFTIDELQQSFFLAMEMVRKACGSLSREIPNREMPLRSVLEGFKVVELGRDLAVELWDIHFVALERSEDDEVIFQGLEDTTRTCFLGAFADYGRPPVLRELNAKMVRETAERKAAERARCLLFCCLERAATAHEYIDPPIGAVPIPVMEGAVKHAVLLITPEPYEQISELEHQSSLSRALPAAHKEQERAEESQAKALEADCERLRKRLQDLQKGREAHVIGVSGLSHALEKVKQEQAWNRNQSEFHAAQRRKNQTRREDEALEMQRKMIRVRLQHAQIVQERKRQASSSKCHPPAPKRARTDDGNGASLGNPTENGEAADFTATGSEHLAVDGETSPKE